MKIRSLVSIRISSDASTTKTLTLRPTNTKTRINANTKGKTKTKSDVISYMNCHTIKINTDADMI